MKCYQQFRTFFMNVIRVDLVQDLCNQHKNESLVFLKNKVKLHGIYYYIFKAEKSDENKKKKMYKRVLSKCLFFKIYSYQNM